jgi:RimJ/RimL family protein N-acetyltransferase
VEDAAFGYVGVYTAHANVGFFHGAELSDPTAVLEGTGKRTRHVKVKPGADLDSAALATLIGAAYSDLKLRLAAERRNESASSSKQELESIRMGKELEDHAICRIRPYEAADAPALYAAARESVAEVHPWLAWCHPGYTLAEAVEWARSQAELAGTHPAEEHAFAIVGPNGRFLGGCGLNQLNPIHRFANLGYWVRTSAAGRGVATEAVRQLAAFAFASTDLVRLEIVCAVGNERSQRVAERAGASREGILRHRLILHGRPVDAVMYGLVRQTR